MKLETATRVLIRECEFLGVRLETLLQDLERAPLAFSLKTIEAYRVYKDLGYR
jgi:hypothetical protein